MDRKTVEICSFVRCPTNAWIIKQVSIFFCHSARDASCSVPRADALVMTTIYNFCSFLNLSFSLVMCISATCFAMSRVESFEAWPAMSLKVDSACRLKS